MQWWLANSHKIADLEKIAASGKKVKTLEGKPELFPDSEEIWQAFLDVSGSRQIGLDENPILISEIEAWLNINGIVELEIRIEYFRLIKILDNFRQEWLWRQQCQKAKNK